ncbi:MAG: hypothetical protein JWM27_749 [Gemmatimonadetes bacterium]|nr:hypothetical protein [Gemmatimonadota bacterium]
MKSAILNSAARFAEKRVLRPTTKDLRVRAAMGAARWAADRVLGRREPPSRTAMLGKGLAAAAVALPLGLYVGSRIRARSTAE